ncbi:MAG: helicase DnaB [Cyanobacteriota bacterium]|nr:helicase DnaB [Cyanobacteriota bacterium]
MLRRHDHNLSAQERGSLVRHPLYWFLALVLLGLSQLMPRTAPVPPLTDPGLVGSISNPEGSSGADPLEFSAAELQQLHKRFGVHGPQPKVAQLFTSGLDQLEPLRAVTYTRLLDLRPVVLAESRRQGVNPMLVMAVLFDELQHAKPGESTPLAAHSGLFSTLGPAQLGLGEMVHQGLLKPDANPQQIQAAREQLLDPERNVALLVGKFARLSRELGYPRTRPLVASRSAREAKSLAVLAYLHNGKLDYPRRVLRYMQDPALHALLYGKRKLATTPVI